MAKTSGQQRDRLPRGRHSLTREQVAGAQRERLLHAMAEVMAERGYAETTVADVLRVAGISRETFYQQFSSKLDCFIAAYEMAAASILSGVERRTGTAGTPIERFERAIGAYLEALASEPALARVFLLEVYAAGPAALELRAELQGRFADALAAALDARDETERFACEALVAAVGAMVTGRLAAGDGDGVRGLGPPLTALVRRALINR
jgi:AcrR family transcriptional regulator